MVLVLHLYNHSEEPIFVSRLKSNEFVKVNVIGPDGKEVPWQEKARSTSKEYSSTDFAVLNPYQEITAEQVISVKDGTGFVFDKLGQYSVTTEYSLGRPEHLASFAGKTKIPTGSFHSQAAFCVEVCIRDPEPGQYRELVSKPIKVHSNVPPSALQVVRVFYHYITEDPPLGIPQGRAKKALWPLLSKRLAQELESLQACDDDYYRRYGEVLRSHQYKPMTPWLEVGLFSGPIEAAGPEKFTILGSKAIDDKRVDVHLRFNCCGKPASSVTWEGLVTTISENNRWVIDDFVGTYENDKLLHLSDGYPECKGGQWVGVPGEPPY